ncbi:MAG: CoA pyrophosphatase [Streptosporangiaceae bacterium]|jgi:8-oxo-dGTP pyrophosphatase MutT (NUDIX family)
MAETGAGRGPDPRRQPPHWLTELADSAARMDVMPPLQPPVSGGRPSAVLILFADGPDGPDLLFIQRSQGLRQHPGQPAFPGGAIEDADLGPVAAALREAAEEAGVDPHGVDILATLPELFIAHSGFRVVPVLAWWHSPGPVSAVDPREVAAVERIGLAELADPACRVTVRSPRGRIGPGFRVKGLFIWGFTAALVDRLLALGGWEVPWDTDAVHDLEADGGPGELSPGTQDRPLP